MSLEPEGTVDQSRRFTFLFPIAAIINLIEMNTSAANDGFLCRKQALKLFFRENLNKPLVLIETTGAVLLVGSGQTLPVKQAAGRVGE
jgi:hypothetical protein